MSIIHPN